MVAQCVRKLAGRGMQKSGELRMPLWKRATGRKRTDPDRSLGFLRDLHHEIDSFGAVDAGADHEGRALAHRKRRSQRLHSLSIRPEFAADGSRFDRLRKAGPVVDRDRNEGRPAGRLHRYVIGARDRRRDVFRPRRLDAVFDIGPRKFRRALGIEKGLQRQDRARLLARGDHQRGLVAVRGVDIAERVADAGAGVKIGEAGIAGGLRITVGHADDGGFLQAQHVVDVIRPVAQERQFRRAGIAEHLLDAERAQQAEGGVLDGERRGARFGFFTRQGDSLPAR